MKKLIVAGAAMLAATLVSGSAFAVPGGDAKGVTTTNSAVTVGYCRHHYTGCGCARRVVTYTTCGCCNTCCGGGLFGGGFFGIF